MIFFWFVVKTLCAARNECDAQGEDYVVKGDIISRKQPNIRGVLVNGNAWPGATVVYQIESGYRQRDIDLIYSAMNYISHYTCVRFRQRTNEENYVSINPGQGCSSQLGYWGYGKQYLTLQTPYCMQKGLVIHEMLHTLGFDHEQNRYDRDCYVGVHYNIEKDFKFAFDIVPADESDLQDEPYDGESVLHYFWNAFAIDPKRPTITSKMSSVGTFDLGKAQLENRMTDIDIRKLNKYYRC